MIKNQFGKFKQLINDLLFNLKRIIDKKFGHKRRNKLFFLPVAFTIIIALFLIFSNESVAAWWNKDYQYRKVITFNNSGAAISSERKVKIDVDTASLISAAKLQSDCDDLRFTDNTGRLLDHFIDTNTADCNNVSTDVYVKLGSIGAGENRIFMYYGNSIAVRADLGGRKNDFFSDENLGVGLKGYWKMNESAANTCTGGTNDSCDSALINDGAWNGDTTTTATAKLGGRAITTSGGYSNVPDNSSLDITNTLTLSAWIRPSATTNARMIIGKVDNTTGNTQRSYALYILNGALISDIFDNTTGAVLRRTATTTLNSDQWYFVSMTYDGTTSSSGLNIYIDGALATTTDGSSGSFTAMRNVSSALQIGSNIITNGTQGNFFNGQIDDARVYAINLSAAQISSLYNSGNGREINSPITFIPSTGPTEGTEEITTGIVAYWKFDEGQGQTVNDQTKKNNGTMGASTAVSTDDPTWKQESDCVIGKCLQFDGTADYVNVNTLNGISSSEGTISLWVKRTFANDTVGNKLIFDSRIDSNNNIGLFYDSNGDDWDFRWKAGGTTYGNEAIPANTITKNKWAYVTLTWSKSNDQVKVYVDGVQVGSTVTGLGTFSGTLSTATIGQVSNQNFWNGFMDELKIYPYSRSAAQIKADYNATASVLGITNQGYLSDGLVGYWKMDEVAANSCAGGSNDNCDSSGNGYDGAWAGNATSISGKFGNGVTFDGTGDRISMGNVLDNNGTFPMTLSAWVKLTNDANNQGIITKQAASLPRAGYSISKDSTTDTLVFNILSNQSTPDWLSIRGGTVISDSNWHHVTATYDGSRSPSGVKLYVDGKLESTTTDQNSFTGSSSTSSSLNIGSRDNADSISLTGSVDEARIYNRVLSADDVRNLYNWAPGPVGYWNFNEGGGTTANDTSGNVNIGTLTGGSTWIDGKYGKGLNLDGSGDYLSIANESNFDFSNTQAFSACSWINPDNVTDVAHTIVSKYNNSINVGWEMTAYDGATTSDGIVVYLVNSHPTNRIALVVDNIIQANTWQHVCFTYSGSSTGSGVSIYKNGIKQTATIVADTLSGSIVNNSNVQIGSRPGTSSFDFKGKLDDVKIYNYARSSQQIVEDMNGSHPTGGSPIGSEVVYWAFDDQQGQTAQDRVNNYNATLGATSGSSTDDPTWKTNENCKINGCLSFDGGDFLIAPANAAYNFQTGNPYSVTSWVKLNSTGTTQLIFNKQQNVTNELVTNLSVNSSNQVQFSVSKQNVTANIATGTTSLTTGTWYHIAGVYDGATIRVYLNGNLEGSTAQTHTGATQSLANLYIGQLYNSTNFISGLIDEVKIYNSALTVDQIRIDMNSGTGDSYSVLGNSESADLADGAGNPPIREWKFDDKTGSSAIDTSGNGITGTLVNSPTWESASQCKYGSCLRFSGGQSGPGASSNTGSSVSFTATSIPAAGATISMWFNTANLADMLIAGSTGNPYVQTLNPTTIRVQTNVTGTFKDFTVPTMSINTWYHIAVTRSSNTTRVYLNGIESSSGGQTQIDAMTVTQLGRYNNGLNGFWYTGKIDDVKIYDYARTLSQVAYNYNRGGPVGRWKMDECQGTTLNDSSGNGYNGALNIIGSGTQTAAGSCSTASTAWGNGASGRFNSSMNFDGTDDWACITNNGSCADNNLFDFGPTSDFTFSTWIRTSSSANGHVLSKWNVSGSLGIGIDINHSGGPNKARFHVFNTGASSVYSNKIINDGNWHHIVGVRSNSGTTMQIYVDGQLDNTATVSARNGDNDGSLSLGRAGSFTGLYFAGKADDAQIYNYALSATQIKTLFNENSAVRYGQ